MSYVLVFSRCLLGVVFLVSAVSKLRGFGEFAASLTAMRLLPDRWVTPVAALVAAAELAVVVLLATPAPGWTAVAGCVLAALLLAAFALSIATVLRRGTRASCRCFGGSGAAPFGRHHVWRNVALVAVAGCGAVAALGEPGVDWPVLALAGPVGLVAALVVVRLDDLVELFAPAGARG